MISTSNVNIDGQIEGCNHFLPLRVQYEDTDFGGIVYHTRHLAFMERGRSSFLRILGFPNEELIKTNLILVVSKAEIKWIRQLKIGTLINIETKLIKLKRFSLSIFQRIKDYKDSRIYSEGHFRVASINSNGKITKLNKNLFESLEKFVCLTID